MTLKTNRRKFIERFAITTAAVSLTSTAVKASQEKIYKKETGKFRFLADPYLQNLSPTEVSIGFITSSNAFAWVEYGEDNPNIFVAEEKDGFLEANQRVFMVKLSELKPGTRYAYKIVAKEIISFKPYELTYGEEIESGIFYFTTPSLHADDVSCLILNDIHDRPNSFGDLIALNGDAPYEFVLLNGDIFDYQTDEKQLIDHLIAPCTKLFAKEKPFIMLRGNHETRGTFARNIKEYFAYPDHAYYYSFKQGPVFWMLLDTGEDKPDDEPVYAGIVNFDEYRIKQANWLEKEMQSEDYQNATFKVVFMHIPPFHSGDWHGTMHCRALFSPLFEKYKIDMVISGHTHKYGIHGPQNDHSYPIVIGGGPKEGTRTVMNLQASRKELVVKMQNDSGELVGEYKISK